MRGRIYREAMKLLEDASQLAQCDAHYKLASDINVVILNHKEPEVCKACGQLLREKYGKSANEVFGQILEILAKAREAKS